MAAFSRLVRDHRTLVYRVSLRMLGRDGAEDASQEMWVRVCRDQGMSGTPRSETARDVPERRDPEPGPARTRRADSDRGQSHSASRGLYGSDVSGPNMARATIAELVGIFILVFTGTAVAVAALLERPTAGALVGGFIAESLLGLGPGGFIWTVLVATLGAVILLAIYRAITRSLAS